MNNVSVKDRRNPFVNQVHSDEKNEYEKLLYRSRNPFVNQVHSDEDDDDDDDTDES